MKFNSIKFKVGNLFTIILGVILILYSIFLHLSLSNYLINDLDEDLAAKADEIGVIISEELNASPEESLNNVIQRIFSFQYPPRSSIIELKKRKKAGDSLSEEEKWFARFDRLDLSQDMVVFFEPEGRMIFYTQNITNDILNKFVPELKESFEEDVFKDIIVNKRHFRQIETVVNLPNEKKLLMLVVASEKPIQDLLRHRLRLFFISIPVILLITAFLGRLLAERILNPVNNIIATAKQITSKDLSNRLELKNVDEEMKVLVSSLNDMIARLDNSFKHIEEFSSQVAHELKTPLAILRGATEVSLRKTQSVEEYKNILRDNLEEIEKVIRIVEDLLLSARLDYQPKNFRYQKFDFSEFITAIIEQARIVAAEKNITIKYFITSDEIMFQGDPVHLRRLFFNILNNAIKFTPSNKEVNVKVIGDKKSIKISITDQGPGIAEEHLSRIFDKFYQVPQEEANSEKGIGLGLNIALSIAKAHQGKIEVQSRPNKGSTFTVILPLI